MPDTFSPPKNPSFTVPLNHRFATAQDPMEGGQVATRSRWSRKKRVWKLSWMNAVQTDRDYLVGFVERQLGAAQTFYYRPPSEFYQPRPPLAPTLSYAAGGTLGSRTYYVIITFFNGNGETQASPRDSITVPANNLLVVTAPRFPAGVTGVRVYAATTLGGEVLQVTTITTSQGTWTEPVAGLRTATAPAAVSPPTTNTMFENVLCHFEEDEVSEEEIAPGIFDLTVVIAEVFA